MAIKDKWLRFNGTDGYVDAGRDAEAYRVKKAITIEAWINPDPYLSVGEMGIVSKLRDGSGYGLLLSEGKLIFRLHGTDGVLKEVRTNISVVSAGTWHHVAATYDGTRLRIVVDGVEKTSAAAADADIQYSNEANLYLGRGPSHFFKGTMCEVRIWSVARSASELEGSKLSALDMSTDKLSARWPCDDGSAVYANDVRNGLIATLTGSVAPGPVVSSSPVAQPDLERPAGLINTSGVLTAALDKLNRQSVMGLLKTLTTQIKQQATDIGAVRGDLTSHLTNHTQNIENQISTSIQNLLRQEEFNVVAENLTKLQRELEIVRSAALALDTNELNAVSQTIATALQSPDVAKQMLKANLIVNGTGMTFAQLLNRIARRVEVSGTEFFYSATDITGAIFTLTDGSIVTFNATSSVDADRVITYMFHTLNLHGNAAQFLVKIQKSSTTDQLNPGKQNEVTLSFDEHQAVYHSNVYYNLHISPS